MLLKFYNQGETTSTITQECVAMCQVKNFIYATFPSDWGACGGCTPYFEINKGAAPFGTYWWSPTVDDHVSGFDIMKFVRKHSTGKVRWCRSDEEFDV